jgi:DedD protein
MFDLLGEKMSDQDEEITLGTGRLLGLFFGLVVVCALFFSVGFSLGRRSAPETASAAGNPAPAASDSKTARVEPASKSDAEAKSSTDELTFYKAVEQNEPKAKLEPPAPRVAQVTTRTIESRPVTAEMRRAVATGSGYMVQVAAVRKQEDAEALVRALRRKNYPVLTVAGPSDKLHHVQVGPFADIKLAEATRAKLIGDGYNPIVKK